MAKTPNQKAWDAEIKRIMRELQNTGNAPKLTKYIPKKPQKITQADLAKLRKITPGNIKGIKFGAEPETGEPKTVGKKSEPPRRIRRTSTDTEIPKGRTHTPQLRVKGTEGTGGSGGGRKKQTKPPKPPLTPEEKKRIRSEAGKRRWQNMSQEAKDAAIRRMREGARKRRESMTPEEREYERQRRSKQSKDAWAKKPEDEKEELRRERSRRSREAWNKKSEEEKEAIKARLREAAQKYREEQASKDKTPEEQEEERKKRSEAGKKAWETRQERQFEEEEEEEEPDDQPAPEPSPEQPRPEYVAPYAAVEDEYIQNYLFDFNRGLGVYDEYIRHLLQYVQREGGDVTKLFDILERLRWDGKLAERVQHGYLSEHTLTEMKNVVSALKNEGIDIGLDEDDIEELYEREVGIAEAYERVGLSYHSVIKRFADAQRRKRRDE